MPPRAFRRALTQGRRRSLAPLVVAGLLACRGLWGQTEAVSLPNPLITNAEEYWADGLRDSQRSFRIELVVLSYDRLWGSLWCEINGAPGYLPVQQPPLELEPRDRVILEGTVVPNQGISAKTTRVTVLQRNVPMTPIAASGRLREFSALKGRLVTLEATLDRQSTSDREHFILDLVSEGLRVHAYLWTPDPQQFNLCEGAVIRLTGVYNPKHDSQTENLEIDLWLSGPQDIEIVGNLSSDPRFSDPLSQIEDLSPFMTKRSDAAHIIGVVHAFSPGRITVRDQSGQIVVQTLQRLPVRIGEVVEAVGNRFTGGADWLLRDALVRRAPRHLAAELRERMATPRSVLRLAEQILELSPEEAVSERAVELVGVVIRSRPNSGTFFLRDTSGCVRVSAEGIDSDTLKNGTGVRLVGVTTAGAFAPEVRGTKIEHWGSALLPEAKPITLEQAMTGREQGERVEMRGLVTQVQSDGQWARLTLSTATGEFTAILANDHDRRWLLGSVIAARGICQVAANTRRQLTGIELWLSSGDDIQVEQQALTDPFTAPLRPITALRQFNRNSAINYWARVRGRVTHHLPGRFVYVQEDRTGLLILSPATTPLALGDEVEATGIPGFENQRMILRDAVYRKIGDGTQPEPVELVDRTGVDEDLEDVLTRVEGTLINVAADRGELHFLFETEKMVFGARLAAVADLAATENWPIGSQLSLTGVYELTRDERRQPNGFRLRLRAPADIVMLRQPSWWTPQRGLLVAGGLCVCVLGGFGWATLLRRRVQQQTRQLRDQFAREARLEARHHDIFENASDFIFTTEAKGRITSFNPAGERITGYTRDEAARLNLRDLIASADAEAGLLTTLAAPHEGAVTFQTRLRRKDGEAIWTEISARLIHENGEFTGLLGVVRDISQRKQVEEELKRARDAAESNTQAKSAFLANMSHEIRTPMNGVIGMSNLLLDTPLSQEQRSFAETIRVSGEALLTVLNDILDFSKMEAGKLHLDAVDFDLVATIEEAVDLVAERATAKQLELVAILPANLPQRLHGDPGRLRQVLLNLLGNAIKFTERGEVTLRVLPLEPGDPARLRIEVADTGIGIPEAEQAQLFQPFVQADSSTTRRFGGTGLGLAISKQLVHLMGGSIGVRSRPGQGCTFWINVELRPALVPPASPSYGWADGLRVLILEPNPRSAEALTNALAAWAIGSDVAPSMENALAHSHSGKEPPDLILINHQLPEGRATDLVQSLREGSGSGPPIILLRPVDVKIAADELAQLGIAAAVKKPARRHLLLEALQVALDVKPEQGESLPSPTDSAQSPVSLRVLVAEDNPVNQRLILLQLKKLGHHAEIAQNGFEALQALSRGDYDLVLMDCQMPEMDGYAATQKIRENPQTSSLRVVAMTANAMRGDREKCLAAGMDDYLSKPVRMEALTAILQPSIEALRARQQSQ